LSLRKALITTQGYELFCEADNIRARVNIVTPLHTRMTQTAVRLWFMNRCPLVSDTLSQHGGGFGR